MPSFAEMIYATAQDSAQKSGSGLAQGFAQGAELAMRAEEIKQARYKIKLKQQELLNAKIKNFSDDIAQAEKYKDPKARNNYLKTMKGRRDAYQLQEFFSDESIDALQIPEDFGRAVTLSREVNREGSPFYGRGDLAAKAYNDPVQRAKIDMTSPDLWGDKPEESADLNRAMELYNKNKAEKEQAKSRASGTQGRFETKETRSKEDTIRKDVNKVTDEFSLRKNQFQELKGHVQSGNAREIGMVIAAITRNIGDQKGALSDQDVARALPRDVATDVSGLLRYLGSENAQISEPLKKSLINLIEGAEKKAGTIFKESIQRRRKQYSSGTYADVMGTGLAGDVIFTEAENLAGDTGGADTVEFNGKTWTRKALQAVIDKNPDHPKSKDAAKVLGGKK